MNIYILTRGRVNKQITLESIPKRWAKDTYLVCTPIEAREHEALGRQCKVVPPSVIDYSTKFQWLIDGKADKEVRQFIMMDDDLHFNMRHPTEERLLPVDNRELTLMFDKLRILNKRYPLSGIHPRQLGHNKETPFVENGRILCVHNINLDLFPKKLMRLDAHPILADKLLNCALLSQGIPNAVLTAYTVDWGSVQAPGGCSDYRTLEMQEAAVKYVAEKFGPFAKAVMKKPKTAKWLGDERWDLQIQWKRMYKAGVEANER